MEDHQEDKPVLGRPPKLGADQFELLRILVAEHPHCTVAELNAMLSARSGVSVSLMTLGKALRQAGIVRIRPVAAMSFAAPDVGPQRYGYAEQHRAAGDLQRYSSCLTDAEWALVSDLFEPAVAGRGKPARYPRRAVLDACCYVVRTGCAWRLLPKSFPPWNAVFKTFSRWSAQGRFELMHDRLRQQWRERTERAVEPSVAVPDSQSTRTSPQGGVRGFDAGKRVKGRKRNLVVDTLGLLLSVAITAASVQDCDAARPAMALACAKYPSLKTLYVDSAYAGTCAQHLQQAHALDVRIVRHPGNRTVGRWHNTQLPLFAPSTLAFAPLPKRWIVERSHAWLERGRRLVMHHDRRLDVSAAWVWLNEARRLLRGLTHVAVI
ncbi:MAG: IS5 family transposase [Nevskia sp.]|nr:IS5 family transposase [Nevskia sp.]